MLPIRKETANIWEYKIGNICVFVKNPIICFQTSQKELLKCLLVDKTYI